MKKILFITTLLFSLFFGFSEVKAASINMMSDAKSVVVGNNFSVKVQLSSDIEAWQFSIDYDETKLRFVDSDLEKSLYSVSSSLIHSRNYTLTFKAISAGDASIYVSDASVYDSSEKSLNTSKGSVNVSVKTEKQVENSYNKNNNLASLSVDGATLSPAFNQDTLNYSVNLDSDVRSINVIATPADKTASITGDGTLSVSEGDNNIKIVVKAENGATKTYTIKAYVKEYDPIKLKIGKNNYTIVRNKDNLGTLNGYEQTTVKINGNEVPALKSKITKYTLIALKDKDGNQNYYIVGKNNKYTLYKEYTFNKVILYPMDNQKVIPKNYKEYKIEYNGDKIKAYKLKKSSKYALIYGMNVETGEKHLYMYDSKEDTLQIYNNEEIKFLEQQNKLYLKVLIALSVLLIIMIFIYLRNILKKKEKNALKVKLVKTDK